MAQTAKAETSAATFTKPPRLPYHPGVKERFGFDEGAWRTLVEAIYPTAKTVDAVCLALDYCRVRSLDPFKRPVHIVPMYSAAANKYIETVWPGIHEMRSTAFRTKQYAGMDEPAFGPDVTMEFEDEVDQWEDGRKVGKKKVGAKVTYPEWCRCTVYRTVQGAVCKWVGPKVYWEESYATIGKTDVPNEMWQSRPIGQLEKCAEAAALRRAFPEELGNELSADEMSGRVIEDIPVAIAAAAQETKALMRPPAIPTDKIAAPPTDKISRYTGPVGTNDYPELPAILDRRNKDASDAVTSGDGEGAGEKGSAARHEPASPEPAPDPEVETLKAIIASCENAVSESAVEEIEQMYAADMDRMSRNNRQQAEQAIGEAYERLRKVKPPEEPAPQASNDPFAVPASFRDRRHLIDWLQEIMHHTKTIEDAAKLRDAFNASKPARSSLLDTETYDRVVQEVKAKYLSFGAHGGGASAGAGVSVTYVASGGVGGGGGGSAVQPPPIPAEKDDGLPKTWEDYCAKTREVMAAAKTSKEIQVDWLLKTADLRQKLWPSMGAYEAGLKIEIRNRLDELHSGN